MQISLQRFLDMQQEGKELQAMKAGVNQEKDDWIFALTDMAASLGRVVAPAPMQRENREKMSLYGLETYNCDPTGKYRIEIELHPKPKVRLLRKKD